MNRRSLAQITLAFALLGAPACGGSTPPAAEAAAPRRPSDVYTAYVEAIGNAAAVKEVYPFLTAAARRRLPGDLETIKAKVPGGVLKFVNEKVEGDKATLTIAATILDKAGKEQPATGTVVMVKEEGGWKVDQESWAAK